MLQIFRLIKPGFVDKMIAFDELPERLVKNVPHVSIAGLPRHWKDTAIHENKTRVDKFSKLPVEESHDFHYGLEYDSVTADIEKWEQITQFSKKACDLNQRLTDKLETMAVQMAPDAHAPLSVEPEDIPVIKIPLEYQEKSLPPIINPVPAAETITTAPQTVAIIENKDIMPKPLETDEEARIIDDKCSVCGKSFEDKRGFYFHKKSHKIKVVA